MTPGFRRWNAAAFLWGLAEATFFFVVPDVLLSWLTVRHGFRRTVRAALVAVAGASIGGPLMWQLGRLDPVAVRAFLDAVPAVSPDMIVGAEADLRAEPVGAMFAGAFSGVPYKVLAAVAPGAGVSLIVFLVVGVAARLARFLAVMLIASAVDRALAPLLGQKVREGALAAFWIAFYAGFWLAMPN